MKNNTMITDFYELTMAQTYFEQGKKDEIVYFDIFFRKNPFDGGYLMVGGLESIIEYLENFHFEERHINYLRSLGTFKDEFLDYLKEVHFTGNLYAMEEGTVAFPNEPVLTVRTNVIEAQLIETALLACFNHASLVMTSAKRITNEANGIPVMEFGARRARGLESSVEASKYAYLGGCVGTSNTEAGYRYHIPVMGTMAHSLIQEAEDEYQAFLNYAKSNPHNCVFLVDTYDTLQSGIPNAIRVAKDYLIPNGFPFKGIRIDSGDLAYLSKEARRMLDEAGFTETGICLSNGLDEFTIRDLKEQGACMNSLGVGDNISASKERVGGVYKLVAVEENNTIAPRIKVSGDTIKTTTPGYKKVYRFYDQVSGYALGDVITVHHEKVPHDHYTLVSPVEPWKKAELENFKVEGLQKTIYQEGQLVYQLPSLEERRKFAEENYHRIYPEVRRIQKPAEYYVDLSDELRELKNQLLEEHTKTLRLKKGKIK